MRKTQKIKIGNVIIGGGEPIAIQSMTNTPTSDVEKTINQINELIGAGCDIVRLAVSDMCEVSASKEILKRVKVPLVADIQFDYKLAIACSDIGFNKVRFNPGNIGSESNVSELVKACKINKTPIRVGVNSGSIEKDLLGKYGKTGEALAYSALNHVALLEKFGFHDIVVSVKASDINNMIAANRIISEKCDYPLHLGVTESGAYDYGLVKSAIGIGSLLSDGIGDTIRVSLTGNPVSEISAAKLILQSLRLKEHCEIVSCPTCSRCKIDLLKIVDEVNAMTKGINKNLKIAVMGCVVNGPGEAKDADFGIAGGDGKGVIFKKGEIIKTVSESEIIPELKKLIDDFR